MSQKTTPPGPRAADSAASIARVGHGARGIEYEEPVVFERSRPGREGCQIPRLDVPPVSATDRLGAAAVRADLPGLPELSEVEVVRHCTDVSTWDYGVDLGLYAVGFDTMK